MSQTIQQAAHGRWPFILSALGADASALDGKHHPCPACGGTDRFRFDDKGGNGSHICSQCGAGDGFALLQKMHGCDFKEAAKLVENALGIEGSKPPSKEQQAAYRKKMEAQRKKREAKEAEARRLAAEKANRLWEAAAPAPDDHPYLQRKGVKAHGLKLDGDCLVVPVRIGVKRHLSLRDKATPCVTGVSR